MPITIAANHRQVLFVVPERLLPHYLPMIRGLTDSERFGTVVQTSAADALWHLEAMHLPLPHAVIVVEYDHGFDGAQLISSIRTTPRAKHLPIVALSSDSDPRMSSRGPRAIQHGANEFHCIPIDVGTLAGRIRRLVPIA